MIMLKQKLDLEDFLDTSDYALIGIHSPLESYRLAYFLNKELQIHLSRQKADLDFGNNKCYEIFEWEDVHKFATWHLVSNTCRVKIVVTETDNTLFSLQDQQSFETHHLIPEYKKVNYFLKITDDAITDLQVQELLKKIQNIPNVVTAYRVNPAELKSKINLIFY
jgi:hypothetical protein